MVKFIYYRYVVLYSFVFLVPTINKILDIVKSNVITSLDSLSLFFFGYTNQTTQIIMVVNFVVVVYQNIQVLMEGNVHLVKKVLH